MNLIEKYETIIRSQSGVLYIKGKPGTAKTAILEFIAKKNNWQYFDRRCAQKDSSEIIGIPKTKKDNDTNYDVTYYAYPQYLIEANKKPTLIVFEEFNRATLETRNAALSILLERRVEDLELNNNVYMAMTGNLGEEDGTEVEEFDTALNGRLIHMIHDLSISEWRKNFADDYVNPHIVKFLENNPDQFYKLPTDDTNKYPAYPSPRTWTFLSDLLGKNSNPGKMLSLVKEVGYGYIGTEVTKFLRYLEDTMVLNINDVIDRYDQVKVQLKKVNRDKISELLNELKAAKVHNLTDKQYENINRFLKLVDADERVGFLSDILGVFTRKECRDNKNFLKFLRDFRNEYSEIRTATF